MGRQFMEEGKIFNHEGSGGKRLETCWIAGQLGTKELSIKVED